MPEMRNRRNDKILRAVTRNASAPLGVGSRIRLRRETRKMRDGEKGGRNRRRLQEGFVLSLTASRRGINSLEGNPLDPRSVTTPSRASRRRCLHYFNGVRALYAGSAAPRRAAPVGPWNGRRSRRHHLEGCYEIGRIIISWMEPGGEFDENANNGRAPLSSLPFLCGKFLRLKSCFSLNNATWSDVISTRTKNKKAQF